MRRLLLLSGLIASSAWAQTVVVSSAPDSTAVTVYRAPDRASNDAMNLGWLQGYALITEKRTISIPQGRAMVRFEGVAAGLFPESAIISGLPAGVREKNMDADLLSPRTLYARAFGREVLLRRLHPKSGKERLERAVIRSGPDGSAILQTADGFEAINCAGLTESIAYPDLPADLSAKPTLSVETDSPAPAKVTISLSYLAWGFDWQANYVLRMHDDGRRADLNAWVTLASSDSTSYPDAEAALVAGKVNREAGSDGRVQPTGADLTFRCFLGPPTLVPTLASPPAPAAMMMEADAMITMTAMRSNSAVMKAPVTVVQEGLGDLKLYRVPIPTTVAANAQKQVMLAQKHDVKVTPFVQIDVYDSTVQSDAALMLRTRNRKEDGLGLPLPGGPITVFEPHGDTALLIGEGGVPDKAVGEDLDLRIGTTTQMALAVDDKDLGGRTRAVTLTASNARAQPVLLKVRILADERSPLLTPSTKLRRKDGRDIWRVTVPANGRATLRYKLQRPE